MGSANEKLYAAIERQRNWVPSSSFELIFRKWTTRHGIRRYAESYGYHAWPMMIRRRLDRRTSSQHHEHFPPIESSYRLEGGFKVGDRVRQRYWGTGTIISIDAATAVIQFDDFGFREFDRLKAHYLLTKLS
jgi:hypothetical protein